MGSAIVAPNASAFLIKDLDTLIARLRHEQVLRGPTAKSSQSQTFPLGDLALPLGEDFDILIARLTQIRDWLHQDSLLLEVVDTYIGQHVREAETRTRRHALAVAVFTTIGGAILGWLLSILSSPAQVLQLFGH